MTSHLTIAGEPYAETATAAVSTPIPSLEAQTSAAETVTASSVSRRTSDRPLRVVHLLGGSEGGGITTAVAALLSSFYHNQVEASVVILRRRPTAGDAKLSQASIQYLPKTRGKLGTVIKLARFCRRQQVDVLHTHSISSNFYGRLARLVSSHTRLVTTVHARTRDEIRGSLGNTRLEQFIAQVDLQMHRRSDRLIAVSEWLKNDLIARGVNHQRVHAVSHGIPQRHQSVSVEQLVELRTRLGIPEDSRIVAIVGRLTPVKNHALLIEAMRRLQQDHPDTVLLVVGDGALRSDLEALAERTLRPGTVRFTGWVDNVTPYLHLSDLLVTCSQSEGFGYTVLEAMACGTPVVATAVAALPEIVRGGETGLLVPPDDAAALAEAIRQLLIDPDRRARMGTAGRADIDERFSLQQEVEGTLSVYQQLHQEQI